MNLHGVQYRIVRRGAELLDVGGRLVYSTCSLNPVENESVLHRLLRDSDGALELIDVSELVPGLKYTPGISHWEIADKECRTFYQSFQDVPEELRTVIRPQMFPPEKEDAKRFSLHKCLRILPHFQNTGGFFVAALYKKCNLPWEKNKIEPHKNIDVVEGEKSSQFHEPQIKKRKFFGYKEDPFVFFGEEEDVWKNIKSFYDINDSKLEFFKPTQLLTRSLTGKKKNIYFCSDAVKKFVQNNEGNVKIINTGIKVFSRCDHRSMRCEYRMANEGLESINSVIGDRRRVEVSKDDLIALLEGTDPKNPPELELMSVMVKERMKELEAGSCLLVYKDSSGIEINIVGWKGAKSLRAYIDLNESIHNLRLLGADVAKFEVNKFIKKVD